jgi:hypothetical protein
LIDRAGAFIGNDSGPGHLAAFCGVPTFTLFGPQLPEWFAPLHPGSEWLEGKACPYKPCSDYCRYADADLSVEHQRGGGLGARGKIHRQTPAGPAVKVFQPKSLPPLSLSPASSAVPGVILKIRTWEESQPVPPDRRWFGAQLSLNPAAARCPLRL